MKQRKGMPRSLSALVIASSVVAPVRRIASMTGKRPVANWLAAPILLQEYLKRHDPTGGVRGA